MVRTDADRSRFLSLVLRHEPGRLGLTLDPQGWVAVADLLAALPFPRSEDDLARIVRDSDKPRFALSPDGRRIRANQGHSVSVDLRLSPQQPPGTLFHGTQSPALAAILSEGLRAGARQHVHLSADSETAARVGARRGDAVVLRVEAGAMAAAGHVFYRSDNGVWLTEAVPPQFLAAMP